MSNLHPGLILILTGIVAAVVPKVFRRVILVAGPADVYKRQVIGTISTIFFVAALKKIDRWCK